MKDEKMNRTAIFVSIIGTALFLLEYFILEQTLFIGQYSLGQIGLYMGMGGAIASVLLQKRMGRL